MRARANEATKPCGKGLILGPVRGPGGTTHESIASGRRPLPNIGRHGPARDGAIRHAANLIVYNNHNDDARHAGEPINIELKHEHDNADAGGRFANDNQHNHDHHNAWQLPHASRCGPSLLMLERANHDGHVASARRSQYVCRRRRIERCAKAKAAAARLRLLRD
jgi:hypothetical protein